MNIHSNDKHATPDLQELKEGQPVINGFRPTWLQACLYIQGCVLVVVMAGWVSSQRKKWNILQAWEVWLAVVLLACYAAGVWLIASRINPAKPQRVGKVAWSPAVVASTTIALVIISFYRHCLSSPAPWLTLWLAGWLIARTFYFSNAVRDWTNPDWIRQVLNELLRGLLLLQGCILVCLLPALPGVISFAVCFILFPLARLTQRRKKSPDSC